MWSLIHGLCIFAAMNAQAYFSQLSRDSSQVIKALKTRLLRNSLVRLGVFLVATAAVVIWWGNGRLIIGVVAVSIATFLILVKYHVNLKQKLKVERAFQANCEIEIEIIGGSWRAREDGKEFIDGDHPYASDLNVFGQHGLFQYLNRTKTSLARLRLAEWLKTELIDPDAIHNERSIIADLAKHPDFLIRLLAYAEFAEADKTLFQSIKNWSTEKEFTRSKIYWILTTRIIPLYAFASAVLYAIDLLSFNTFLLTLILPGGIVGASLTVHTRRFTILLKMLSSADQFESMLELIKQEPFESEEVNNLLQNAALSESTQGLSELKKIVDAIESRNNVFVSIVLNLFLMWDFQCALRLHKWKDKYATQLPLWLDLANTFETYASLGLYVFDNPNHKYATLTEGENFEMLDARHVLMDKKAVPNSMQIAGHKRFFIITGANMAGKSTFLRTVGINFLLSLRGLPVNVSSMTIRPTHLFTSMLAADSLGDNESYFFNELKRLRQMVDKLENNQPLFVILDEILKGTNSVDKAEGSRRFMEKLLNLPVKGLIATHDLSLCNLSSEHPEEIENKKFEVRFDGDELVFDYKLEAGICQNMNASFLLRKMGLTEE